MQALTAYLCPYRTPSYCGWTRPFSVCFEKIYFFKITTHLQRLQNYHTSPWILNPVLQCDLTDLFVNGPSSHSAKIKYCSTGGAVGTCIHISLVNVLAVEWNNSRQHDSQKRNAGSISRIWYLWSLQIQVYIWWIKRQQRSWAERMDLQED